MLARLKELDLFPSPVFDHSPVNTRISFLSTWLYLSTLVILLTIVTILNASVEVTVQNSIAAPVDSSQFTALTALFPDLTCTCTVPTMLYQQFAKLTATLHEVCPYASNMYDFFGLALSINSFSVLTEIQRRFGIIKTVTIFSISHTRSCHVFHSVVSKQCYANMQLCSTAEMTLANSILKFENNQMISLTTLDAASFRAQLNRSINNAVSDHTTTLSASIATFSNLYTANNPFNEQSFDEWSSTSATSQTIHYLNGSNNTPHTATLISSVTSTDPLFPIYFSPNSTLAVSTQQITIPSSEWTWTNSFCSCLQAGTGSPFYADGRSFFRPNCTGVRMDTTSTWSFLLETFLDFGSFVSVSPEVARAARNQKKWLLSRRCNVGFDH
jgi:hypothetical protein